MSDIADKIIDYSNRMLSEEKIGRRPFLKKSASGVAKVGLGAYVLANLLGCGRSYKLPSYTTTIPNDPRKYGAEYAGKTVNYEFETVSKGWIKDDEIKVVVKEPSGTTLFTIRDRNANEIIDDGGRTSPDEVQEYISPNRYWTYTTKWAKDPDNRKFGDEKMTLESDVMTKVKEKIVIFQNLYSYILTQASSQILPP